jgi:hypothetical protein
MLQKFGILPRDEKKAFRLQPEVAREITDSLALKEIGDTTSGIRTC